MKIAVALTGRSHLLNVAKSLISNGHTVTFYTCIPKSRCIKFGLSSKNIVSFFPILGWLFIYRKIECMYLRNKLLSILDFLVDRMIALRLKPCDVVIGASAVAVKTLKTAKEKYGAVTICDCGTKHVLAQNSILQSLPNAQTIYKTTISRELINYDFADYITVAASHSLESFVQKGIAKEKLFKNPYGVNLSMFKSATKCSTEITYDVIIVGTWRYIKGVDLLVETCKEMGISLLHVGNYFPNCPFPAYRRFTHIDAVPESKLIEYYSKAKVFVLPSRAEGLALVLAQAIAVGLPIVYSKDTGGTELKALTDIESEYMIEMPTYSKDSLAKCIKQAIRLYDEQRDNSPRQYIPQDKLDNLSWDAYGKRYNEFFQAIGLC